SPRAGTPASRMPQVPGPVRRERAARLRTAGDAARARFLAGRVGILTEVLVETPGVGRCPWYAPVAVPVDAEPGSLLPVHIRAADAQRLYAETTT
ncbi:MAG TPA: tRNA (N(6)-L-threonylcarbamoyladenosine(37)-C(2))-methylthiotransferase MtaB, partial [Rhodospirillales bacterium]|nr:tRNA (N(6)-L-threonylcarbamoyladenosine(37)-C(2))-methylthiotransferase MtaB [Rhodospirillales bacterium]